MSKNQSENPYADMLYLPRPVSYKHPPMSLYKRAAQFASFSVLTGYDEKIEEEARFVDRQIELDDSIKEELNTKLQELQYYLSDTFELPEIDIVYFLKDNTKQGGQYQLESGYLKKIDIYQKKILMANGKIIDINDLIEIEIK